MARNWMRRLLKGPRKAQECDMEESIKSTEKTDIEKPPYLEPRVRDLEYPLATPSMIGSILQQTFEQEQSRFMCLPAELRLAIYEVLFGYQNIHLYFGYWPGELRGGRVGDDFFTFWNR